MTDRGPDYRVRRSDRARRARVVVSADGGVEVVLPRRAPLRQAERLVAEKHRWIERTLRRLDDVRAAAPVRLEEGGFVPYLGEELELSVRVEPERVRPHVARRAGRLEVAVDRPGPEALRDALERWYRRRARAEVAARLDAAVRRAGTAYGRLSIRSQETRWASCSSSGEMSFNWRLLLAPAAILDYVVEHEVAHIEVPDHSERFWALVAARSPGCREQERWLRHHGPALRL